MHCYFSSNPPSLICHWVLQNLGQYNTCRSSSFVLVTSTVICCQTILTRSFVVRSTVPPWRISLTRISYYAPPTRILFTGIWTILLALVSWFQLDSHSWAASFKQGKMRSICLVSLCILQLPSQGTQLRLLERS